MRPVRPDGPPHALVAALGDAPGVDEARRARPWVGRAGRLFDNILYAVGLDRTEIYLDNLSPYIPAAGVGHLSQAEIEANRDRIESEILLGVVPRVIISLGRPATRFLLGDVDMEAVHGLAIRTDYRPAGWDTPLWSGVVVPSFNPAAGLHDVESLVYVHYDLHQAAAAIRGDISPIQLADVHPYPHYHEGFHEYLIHPQLEVAVDTEGYPDAPWCLSYSAIPGRAYIIRYADRHNMARFKAWIARVPRVLLHSAMYDLEMLRAMGIDIRPDQIRDTAIKAYNLQVEPRGLKALAYRWAGMEMQSYDDLVKPYDQAIARDYLECVLDLEWPKPEPVLERKKGGEFHVRQPQALHTRVRSIFTSLAKDPELSLRKRWVQIEDEIREPAEAMLGPMRRFSFDDMPRPKAIYYAGRDADATKRIAPCLRERITECKLEDTYTLDLGAIPMFSRMQEVGFRVKPGYFEALSPWFQERMDVIRLRIEQYNRGDYVNPGSSQQVAELLFGRLRLPIQKFTKGHAPSTQDKVLEALRFHHPVVGDICDWRELANLKDKFSNKLPRYVHDDGRVRGNIRTTTVVTGRASMTDPPMMAIPVRTEEGRRIRTGFIAGPGMMLGSCDLNQIEMRVMADVSGDPMMIDLFVTGQDIHAITAARMFGVKLEDVDEMRHRYPAKRVGFGVITGITGSGLYDQMRLAGVMDYSVADCDQMIEDWFGIYRGVRTYIMNCRANVRATGEARDRSGRIRYLPGVYSDSPNHIGSAERDSHSHYIQGTAQWIIKRAMARIWAHIKDLPRWTVEPLLQIHDELIFEFEQEREAWVREMVVREMVADTPLFKVPLKAKFNSGTDWGMLK